MTRDTIGVRLEDVARHAGVSPATASRALNDHPHVAAATRERVQRAAAELDYVASPDAARLAGAARGRVAVVVPHLARWYFGALLEGLESVLRAAEVDLLLFRVGDAAERHAFFAKLPARRKVDAVAVLGFPLDDEERVRLASMGVDIVSAGERMGACPSVGIDDHATARRAVDHLLHLGHRRIGMVAARDPYGPDRPHGRLEGYRAALADAGLPGDDELVVTVDWGGEGGAVGAARLLGLREPPTAVFAHSDEVALGVVRTLGRAGLRVPGDLSVIGVDDHPLADLVGLTTVAQPVREQGAVAGRMLRTILGGGDPPASEVLETRLVLRGTTAPPARSSS